MMAVMPADSRGTGSVSCPGALASELLLKVRKNYMERYRDQWAMRPDFSDPHLLCDLEQVTSPESRTKTLGCKDHVLTRPGEC